MRPFDPRLLRVAAAARFWIAAATATTIATAITTVVIAWALAHIIATVVTGDANNIDSTARIAVIWLTIAFACRAILTAVQNNIGQRASFEIISDLRQQALHKLVGSSFDHRYSGVTPTITSGLDALENYLTRFLPQLLATAIVTPGLLLVIAHYDVLSAIIAAALVPLIPLFMALVGWATQKAAFDKQLAMRRLGDQLLDLVNGLPTLRQLRRATDQKRQVAQSAENLEKTSMSLLRRAFMSSMVLEMVTTLSVAILAVEVGLRLLHGQMELFPALIVLILAPEVYLPLRLVGQQFHASADGTAALANTMEIIELPQRPAGTHPVGKVAAIRWADLSVDHGTGNNTPHQLSVVATPGTITAFTGPNGCGKSTAVLAALGLVTASGGRVELQTESGGGHWVNIDDVERRSWHEQVAWVPQQPSVVSGTLLDNLLLPNEFLPGPQWLEDLAQRCGLADVLEVLPHGWHTRIGRGGFGLSAGQRHRVALARAVARLDAGISTLIVDEPTAHIDPVTEVVIQDIVQTAAARGITIIVIAHRPTLIDIATQQVNVTSCSSPSEKTT